MILSAIAAKLKQRAKANFRGWHFEAALIVQAMSWYHGAGASQRVTLHSTGRGTLPLSRDAPSQSAISP